MTEISYFTEEGLKKLKDELHLLKSKGRLDIAQQIAEARDKGDLSEMLNMMLQKKLRGFMNLRYQNLENLLVMLELLMCLILIHLRFQYYLK